LSIRAPSDVSHCTLGVLVPYYKLN
jgi:hypothetical protein